MLKSTLFILCSFMIATAIGQTTKNDRSKSDTTKVIDSLLAAAKDNALDNIPVVTLDENDLGDGSAQNVSSALTAGRDPFFNAASYNFSTVRFRIRGYDADAFSTFMNGIPMENLDNGFTPFGLWGGLNDVMRNRELNIGLHNSTFAFGDLGSAISIDSRASKQRAQTEYGYALSNRNYTHRFTFTHSTGISKKGWAFSVSGSRRWANEGYIPGTYYDGWSYFAAVDKRINQKHLLSLVVFGAPTENGKQGSAINEMVQLSGSVYYNNYWGYQEGKKRNANIGKTNQPYAIFTHDYRISNNTSLITAIAYSNGDRSASSLDWYNAPDPRPDYYRYLPSYQTDPVLKQMVTDKFMTDESVRQINWTKLYEANRSNTETVNGVTGKRSRYLLQENVTNSQRFNFNTVLNTKIDTHIDLTAGASYQAMTNNYYRRANDLLGGDYFVDLNQFAERSFPSDPNASQNDLNRPNRIVRKGDRYGYDYDMHINKAAIWAQEVFKYAKWDFFVAAELSYTEFWRIGNVRSGLFPNNSFGKSRVNTFLNYAVKGGATYKINGRNYLYVNGAYLTRAPFFENVYISPRTRDFEQNNLTSENIKTIEGGYILNAPKVKVRLSGYYTRFDNQMNVLSYYDDQVQNFVNYALSNIDKQHFGAEFGFDVKLLPSLSLNGAASVGRYYYDSRQYAVITLDNDNSTPKPAETVYSQNFRVGGTPQEAFSLGLSYRSPKFWFLSLTGNYFDQMWLDINPIRRTYRAIESLGYVDPITGDPVKDTKWAQIIDQTRFNSQFTLDFFGGWSWKLPKSYGFKKSTFLVFNAGVNNLLNNQQINTGGFEQLRFDFDDRNANKFPPRLYYAYGTNYFVSVAFRY